MADVKLILDVAELSERVSLLEKKVKDLFKLLESLGL